MLEKSTDSPSRAERQRWQKPAALFLCFAVALGAALAHIALHHPETRIIQDSEFFLRNGEQLARLLFAPQTADFSLADFRWGIVNNGPIMPLLVTFAFALTGKLPSIGADSSVVFVVQCVLHACTAAVVYLLGTDLTKSRKAGLAAGLLWGLYPPALCGACLLMAECMSVFSLVLLAWLNRRLVESDGNRKWAFAVGVCTAWILYTRAALLPACLAINLAVYAFVQLGRLAKLKLLAFTCIGLAMLIIPWAVATKMLGGNAELLPNRNGNWNLCLGCDTSAGGWQTMPVTQFTQDNYQRKPFGIIKKALKEGPAQLGTMMVCKVTRLWGHPWLDYHKEILGLSVQAMTGIHQTLILFGVFGFLSLFSRIRSLKSITTPPTVQKFMAFICVAVVATHFCFVPFEAVPRYSLTAIPFVLLAAVCGLNSLLERKKLLLFMVAMIPPLAALLWMWHCDLMPYLVQATGSIAQSQPLWFVAHALLLAYMLVVSWLFLRQPSTPSRRPFLLPTLATGAGFVVLSLVSHAQGYFSEWNCQLSSSCSACRNVSLAEPAKSLTAYQPEGAEAIISDAGNADWSAILVDADDNVENALFKVNGHELSAKPVSMYDVPDPYRYQMTKLSVLKTVVQARNDGFSEIRQWRLVPVPMAYLNLRGQNKIEVTANRDSSPVTIYGDYASPGVQKMPSLRYYSVGKLQFLLNEREGRIVENCTGNPASSRNWLVGGPASTDNDLSPAGGVQDGRYRLFIALGYSTAAGRKHSPDAQDMPLTFADHTMRVH